MQKSRAWKWQSLNLNIYVSVTPEDVRFFSLKQLNSPLRTIYWGGGRREYYHGKIEIDVLDGVTQNSHFLNICPLNPVSYCCPWVLWCLRSPPWTAATIQNRGWVQLHMQNSALIEKSVSLFSRFTTIFWQ